MTNKALFWVIGSLFLLGSMIVLSIGLWGMSFLEDLEGARVEIKSPLDVVVGQTFDLEVIVHNERPDRVLKLTDLDLGDEYLDGFTVLKVAPNPKSNTHIPIDNSRSYTFDIPIPSGKSQSFVYTLRAEKKGIFRGDIDACEGSRFITDLAQTVVKDL